MRPILAIEDISIRFGGITALSGLSFQVNEGEIVSVIGPNGAGKTTLFNCISGTYRPEAGTITLGGTRLDRLPQHKRARLGLGRTFQSPALFDSLSVRDNIRAGAEHRVGRRSPPRPAAGAAQTADDVDRLADELGVGDILDRRPGDLALGLRKRVELVRALAGAPRLLLLDEPAAGLLPDEATALAAMIERLRRDRGLTVVLVEHQMPLVMGLSDRVIVLDFGKKIAEGLPAEIRTNPAVLAAYLGVSG